jgi:hypothetical protein
MEEVMTDALNAFRSKSASVSHVDGREAQSTGQS